MSTDSQDWKTQLGDLFDETVSPVRDGYRKAAAVLASFDFHTLNPLGFPPDPAEVAAFTEDSELLPGEPGVSAWTLQSSVRREALRELRDQGKLRDARIINPAAPSRLQHLLDEALGLAPPGTEADDLETLRQKLIIANWLGSEWNVRPAKEL